MEEKSNKKVLIIIAIIAVIAIVAAVVVVLVIQNSNKASTPSGSNVNPSSTSTKTNETVLDYENSISYEQEPVFDNDNKPTTEEGKQNALKQAKSYLSLMTFSRQGLIEQLKYDEFTTEEATYGVDNCGADWKQQAKSKVKAYLEEDNLNKEQLMSLLLYEGFTNEEAEYGISAAGVKN